MDFVERIPQCFPLHGGADRYAAGMRRSMVLISLSACVSSAVAEIRIEKNVPYLGAGRLEKMDVYLPDASVKGPLPVVVWIHGGGWVGGSKSAARELNICTTLAENGYAAFSIDYKLGAETTETDPAKVPLSTVPWPQNIHDCKTAVRFIRKEAARFNIDPERIAVSGGSAGGHLALVTGLSENDAELNKGGLYTDQSNDISCIIDFYGPTVITPGRRAVRFAGKTPEETAANIKAGSPVLNVTKDSPPVLVVHGDKDETCPISFSLDLVEKMKAVGTVHQFIQVPGGKHSFHFQPKEMDLRPAVLEFLGKYLKTP